MKLYYVPGACSLSVHIALKEASLPFSLEKVLSLHTAERKTESGEDYYTVNPGGYVPALKLDDGRVLTEGGSILEYIADMAPTAKLAPAHGSFERAQMRSWLYLLATELLKGMGPLFNPNTTPEIRQEVIKKAQSRYAIFEKNFSDGRSFLLGEQFTVADCYAYVIIGYAFRLKIDMSAFPKLSAFVQRVGERTAVKAAKKAEGLPE